jgi:hypothetical protein
MGDDVIYDGLKKILGNNREALSLSFQLDQLVFMEQQYKM